MTRKEFHEIAAACLAALALATLLQASLDRGAIQGTVTDQQGAVVPGAKVIVKNVDTNVEVNLTTNGEGFYLAPQLVPGKYSVRVSASGFSPLDTADVIVTAGTTTTTDAQLRVGIATQTVEVTAAAPLVERTSSNFTSSVTTRYIQDIPLQGRDLQTLIQLVPGITQSAGPSGSVFGFDSQFGGFPDPLHIVGSNISTNGSQGGAVQWVLDGTSSNSILAGNIIVNPSPDSVGEFNVVDNGLAPEHGWTSGAMVNVVLKSGTNDLHGDIYEFNRNSFFNATNPFARRDAQGRPFLEPRVNFNNFGGTLGGPMYLPHLYNGKNRTFFFVSWDISMLHENKPAILTVPLLNERNGDFTGDPRFAAVCDPANGVTNCIYDPYSTTGPDANGKFHRTPFTKPVIPVNRIDPLAAFYASTFPDPNFVDPLSPCGIYCNNFLGPVGSSQTTHNLSIKIDHTKGEKHKFFGEWLFNPSYYTNFRYPWNGATAQTLTGLNGAQPYRTINQIFALGLTSTLSPTLVNEARAMFGRQNQIAVPNPDSVTANSEVLKRVQGLNFYLFPPFQIVPDISISDSTFYSIGPQQWQNVVQGAQSFTLLDNLTKILGKQTLKGGLMFRRSDFWYIGAWGENFNFYGGLTNDPVTGLGGSGLAEFLLGAVNEFSGSGEFHAPYQTQDYWGFYFQDEYRITPNFTINAGLRRDIFGWPAERHNDIANFNFTGLNPQVPFPGRIDYFGTPQHPSANIFPARKDSLGPRLSFSWSPFGNRKTVIRGGFGLIYSNANDGITGGGGLNIGSGPAFSNFVGYNGDFTGQRPAFRLSDGAPTLDIPPLDFARKSNDQFLGTGTGAFTRGSRDAYAEQWSFYIQRELPANIALSVGYVGTHGLHLPNDWGRNLNYTPTATRLALRNNIYNNVAVDASLAPVYGCSTDSVTGKALCAGNVVLRPYPQYQAVATVPADGFNRYHSFQMKLEKRYAQGLNFILAYTIQKNLMSPNTGSLVGNDVNPTVLSRGVGRIAAVAGGASGGAADGFKSAGAEDPDNRRRYTGLAPDDIPQILNLAVTYELPFGPGKRFLSQGGLAEKLLGGWKLTQNWNFQSGVPMFFTGPCDGISCRPNLIGDPSRGRGSKTRQQLENQWFDPSAFEAPFGSDPAVIQAVSTGFYPDGTPFDYNSDIYWRFGNIGTRPPTGRAPGFWNADMTLAKDLHLTESKYFQFRWEVFNALNHQNLTIPNTNWCLPPKPDGSVDAVHRFGCAFGKITNIQTDPRAMEFALKFYW